MAVPGRSLGLRRALPSTHLCSGSLYRNAHVSVVLVLAVARPRPVVLIPDSLYSSSA